MLQLRPGLHVVRRDDRHLQVGVDPPWRVVVPDDAAVVRLLADLTAGRAAEPLSPAAQRVLRELEAAGMLLDGSESSRAGSGTTGRLVAVEGDEPLRSPVHGLLVAGGSVSAAPSERATLTVVASCGEPHRDDVDEHLRAERPHLLVRAVPHGFVVGPFVRPGATACLRCVDAHLGELDPRRAVVVEQVAGRSHGPLDPALTAVAAGWTVRDVRAYLEGREPTTWSATVLIGADLTVQRRRWTRHPHCGCSWAEDLAG